MFKQEKETPQENHGNDNTTSHFGDRRELRVTGDWLLFPITDTARLFARSLLLSNLCAQCDGDAQVLPSFTVRIRGEQDSVVACWFRRSAEKETALVWLSSS